MLRESFIGHKPSHFHINPIVKAFIISEIFLWSSWNFITPILGVFATNQIANGSIEVAGSVFSVYFVVRVICELITGKLLAKSTNKEKFIITITGITVVTLSYIGLSFSNSILQLFLFYGMTGMGLGIASPPKNALFSSHLDHNKETEEWGLYDGVTFMGMAMASAIGGFIASGYGFAFLFSVAAVINALSAIPYILYMRNGTHKT